jgi:hypothetical protein
MIKQFWLIVLLTVSLVGCSEGEPKVTGKQVVDAQTRQLSAPKTLTP